MTRLLGVCLLLAAPLMSACGPMQSTAYLYDADIQLEAARTAGAEKAAPYEWTLANLYIHQAREEVGYSNYESAVEFARKAAVNAKKAREIANGVAPGQKSADGSATAEASAP